MLSVLRTILDRLEKIEKQLGVKEPSETPKITSVVKVSPLPVTPAVDMSLLQQKAKEILIEARDEAFKIKKEAEYDTRQSRQEALLIERRILEKEENLDRRMKVLDGREEMIVHNEKDILKKLEEVDKSRTDLIAKLEKAAHLTRDEAKSLILSAVEDKLKEDIARKIREAEETIRQTSQEKAREIIVDAMRHAATDYVAEYTVSTIKLTDEDFKGRIIGKEGRNIRAFEMATGVDVDLDEEGVIRLSSFDPVRREVARVTLERLIKDGRIQPVRIEELVHETEKEIEKIMFSEGEKLCHVVGVYNMPADKIALLGRFKYRFSYGQNMIAHTLEETKIGIALARELGADIN